MATLKRRLYRKNSSDTYDTVHIETDASLVYMSNGNTVENQLTSHVHDDRYYTEAESNNLLNGKANAYHTHTMDQVTSLVDEINYLKTSVSNGKSAVASAITDKGISTSATADFNTMANNIRVLNTAAYIDISTPKYHYSLFPYNVYENIPCYVMQNIPAGIQYMYLTFPSSSSSVAPHFILLDYHFFIRTTPSNGFPNYYQIIDGTAPLETAGSIFGNNIYFEYNSRNLTINVNFPTFQSINIKCY